MISQDIFHTALVGRADRAEFRRIRSVLLECSRQDFFSVELFPLLNDVNCLSYDIVFLLESFPGEFTDTQIERVRRQSPLCRFVLIAGTLCEGEKRTGNVPSGVFRYYLWQWMEIKQEIDRFLKQKPTVLSQPQSMTNEEVATFSLFGIREWLQSLPIWKKYVAIQSDDPDMKNYLETLCFQERFQPVMRDKSPELVIFDSSEQPIELTAKRIFLWRNQFPAAHFAVLFTTPRADETETLLKNGADFVFAKPIL